MNKSKNKNNSVLIDLLFNIVIPSTLLHFGTKKLGAQYSVLILVISLAFPLSYSVYDFYKKKKVNFIGVIGFVSILVSGGLAIMHAEGSVMVMKETIFPLVLGVVALVSAYSKRPLLNEILLNPQFFDQEKLNHRIRELNKMIEFSKHLKLSNVLFAFSFLISALLNYILAVAIFKPIDPSIQGDARSAIINDQLSRMNGLSWPVIVIPSMIVLVAVIWFYFRGIKKMTGLEMKDLVIEQNGNKAI